MWTPVRRFWIDCRNAVPDTVFLALTIAVMAGITTHEGILLDLLVALVVAAMGMVIGPTTFVLVRRMPAIRRRARDSGADARGRPQRTRI